MIEALKDMMHEFSNDKNLYMQCFYMGAFITCAVSILVINNQ